MTGRSRQGQGGFARQLVRSFWCLSLRGDCRFSPEPFETPPKAAAPQGERWGDPFS